MGKRLAAVLFLCTASGITAITADASPTVSDRIVSRFMHLDSDQSGRVSLDEYMIMVTRRAHQRFRSMDRNHDGEISPDERAAFWKREQDRWYRLNR
ncbi:MAG: thymidylate synthase [Mariprofundales bacterium]|nr:thymidylate synthase [Mariprofundales bacterium]